MTEFTRKFIYSIKRNGDTDSDLNSFLRKYYDTEHTYNRDEIDNFLRDACADYISNADNPSEEIQKYFMHDITNYHWDEHKRMLLFLEMLPVKRNNRYINGFSSLEDFE